MTDSPDINKIAAEVALAATERVVKAVARGSRDTVKRMLTAISAAYAPYLETTYRRVSTIRTFLRPNEPVDLLSQYVPASLTIDDGEDEEEISGEDLRAQIIDGARVVISGLAGRGKSVFLRWLAVTFYNTPHGRIPLFLELRSLNSAGSKELLPYIHAQYRSGSNVPLSSFMSALRKGYFVLILDGFDEIEPSSRSTVEEQILVLEREFTLCPIIVSGRPDERFKSWEYFTIYNICPMSFYKTRKIIEKADYDSDVKREFLKRLTKTFFDRHESFLSTPLLAIMLMLTFADFAEIPTSLHVFYRNAFDTLVRRHDALKAQFLRTMHSGCSAEQFRRLFSSFSVITYSKSKFQFNREEALDFISLALRQQNISADPAHVLTDLIESICLLQIEGFEISFVHRSFQEYFCALFVSLSPAGAVALYLDSGRYRSYDSVLPMLYAMVPERVEAEWALPMARKLAKLVEGSANPGATLMAATHDHMNIAFFYGTDVVLHFDETPLGRALAALDRFYPHNFRLDAREDDDDDEEIDELAQRRRYTESVLNLESSGDPRFENLRRDFEASGTRQRGDPISQRRIPFTEQDTALIALMGVGSYYENAARALPELVVELEERVATEDLFIRETFGSSA